MDKKNAKQHSTLTVIPLSSLKPTTKPSKTSIPLGNEIYEKLYNKFDKLFEEAETQVMQINKELDIIGNLPSSTEEEKIIKDFKFNCIKEKRFEVDSKLNL